MNIKIHKKKQISYVRVSEMSSEDQELFSIYNNGSACPFFEDEGPIAWVSDYQLYLEKKNAYQKKHGDINKFKEQLKIYGKCISFPKNNWLIEINND